MARFKAGTMARIDAVRGPGETRPDFMRAAIEREIDRREAAIKAASRKP